MFSVFSEATTTEEGAAPEATAVVEFPVPPVKEIPAAGLMSRKPLALRRSWPRGWIGV